VGFDIQAADQTAPDYSVAENIADNLVDVIRSEMVGNEKEFLALNAAYISGYFLNPDFYLQMIVRGKSGEGKTKLKQTVDKMYPSNHLLKIGSTSDMGAVDSDAWDLKYIGAFAEFQQMQGKMLEMVKSSAGDDADEDGVGFTHMRNVDDGDGGRTDNKIEKQAMPTVFLFADENGATIPQELQTRQMPISVEADEGINRAVVATMFDHQEVSVRGRDHDYNFNFDEGTKAVQNHLANIPKPLQSPWQQDPKSYSRPVVIPHDESVEWPVTTVDGHDTYGWDLFKVIEPIFNYGKTDSKRGGKAIANHVRAWALANYHSRDTVDINGETHWVAEPQDLGNVLSYRNLLLNVTHNMDEQKLAIIQALTDPENGVGGASPNDGVWAGWKDIAEYIEEYSSIPSLSKNQLHSTQGNNGVLDEMVEEYMLMYHDGEGGQGKDMWEYLGGSTFGHPNLDVYPDLFDGVTDPVEGQPIRTTVEDFKRDLKSNMDVLDPDEQFGETTDTYDRGETANSDENDSEEGLGAFSDTDDEPDVDWSDLDVRVCERLRDTIDDHYITPDELDTFSTQHMLGVTDVERYMHETKPHIKAAEAAQGSHKHDTIMDENDAMWGDISRGQVESRIDASIKKLRKHDAFRIEQNEDTESVYLAIDEIEGDN